MPNVLVKRWSDWSAGVGFLIDTERTPGMYYASNILGLAGELRPAPFKNTVTITADEGHHYQYFFEEALANATPVYVSATTGSISNGTTSGNISYTVTANTNRVLLVWVFHKGVSTLTATPVYNGDSMTLYKSKTAGSMNADLFYLVNPDAGAAYNLVVTLSATGDAAIIAAEFYNVKQAAPFHGAFSATGASLSATKTGIDSAS